MREWGNEYGKIFSLKIGSDTIVVLNDRDAVHELIDKRSTMTSNKPHDVIVDTAMGKENFALMDSDQMWRAQRKIASQKLAPAALDKTMRIHEAELCQLLHDMLKTPDKLEQIIKRTTSSAASISIWGFRATDYDSFWCKPLFDCMVLVNASLEPGSHLPFDQFPILKLIPSFLLPSKARARECFKMTSTHWLEGVEKVRERVQRGDIRESIADRLISGKSKLDIPHTPRQFANFLGTLSLGAADTTQGMFLTHIIHLTTHPWVQKKAQEQLDKVCGIDRPPRWDDFGQLPYINCIVKEGLRIRPVAPTGLPHRMKQDEWYDGMLIPANATIFFPAFGLHRNPEPLYTDPDAYNPDRYLSHPRLAMDYAGSPDYHNRDHYSYGSGRRICPGIHLADRTQWRFVAYLLWAFDVLPALDEQGEEIPLDITAYKPGLLSEPEDFKVRFVPRSEKHVEVIEREFANVQGFLKQYE